MHSFKHMLPTTSTATDRRSCHYSYSAVPYKHGILYYRVAVSYRVEVST